MKHFMLFFAMLITSLVAYADNDVGKYEVKSLDKPVVSEMDYAIVLPYDVCEFANYEFMSAVVAEQVNAPTPTYYPVPNYNKRYYHYAEVCTSSSYNVRWRHKACGEDSMSLRFTKYTYKR